jgi:BRCA1-associated RING domain protein 1
VSPQLKENTNTINIIKDDNSEPFKTNNGQPLTDRKPTTPMLKIKRNNLGETPLHSAAIKGDLSQVDRLLNEGADPNVTDNAGWTPLHEACNHGYHDIVKRLISNGALVNIPGYNNDTPLHDAIRNSHYHIVPTLLESGANGSLRNSQGLTPRQLTGNKSLMGLFDTPSPNKDEVLVLNGRTRSDEVVILGSGLKHYQRVQLSNVSEGLRARVVKEFSNEVTHVITDCDDKECCSRTFKCLAAVCSGSWLLKYQWISDSLENGQWMDECHYMIKGFYYQGESWLTNSPYRARCNSLVKNPGLFDGCHFYFSGSYSPPLPNKESLIELVQLAGGHLLTREPKDLDENDIIFTSFPFHANSEDSIFTTCHSFIIKPVISSPSANSPYLAILPCSWVLDCLAHFQLIDFTKST